MDPDSGGQSYSSAIFKTSVLTIAFSSFYFYRTEKHFFIFKPTVQAPVAIIEKKETTHVKKKKSKTIYLTFDDGPNKGTRNVMNIIKDKDVPVTFFVIGEHVYGSRAQSAVFDSIVQNSLFEIANHSFTHANGNRFEKFYAVPDSVVKDFQRCADSLNLVSNIIRTPGRNIWRTDSLSSTDIKSSRAAADSLQRKGFIAMGWDLEWHFTAEQRLQQTADEMLNEIDSAFAKNHTKTAGHLVLLAHDQVYIHPDDSIALEQFIIQLKKKDEYNFETVSKYPGTTRP